MDNGLKLRKEVSAFLGMTEKEASEKLMKTINHLAIPIETFIGSWVEGDTLTIYFVHLEFRIKDGFLDVIGLNEAHLKVRHDVLEKLDMSPGMASKKIKELLFSECIDMGEYLELDLGKRGLILRSFTQNWEVSFDLNKILKEIEPNIGTCSMSLSDIGPAFDLKSKEVAEKNPLR